MNAKLTFRDVYHALKTHVFAKQAPSAPASASPNGERAWGVDELDIGLVHTSYEVDQRTMKI